MLFEKLKNDPTFQANLKGDPGEQGPPGLDATPVEPLIVRYLGKDNEISKEELVDLSTPGGGIVEIPPTRITIKGKEKNSKSITLVAPLGEPIILNQGFLEKK